MSSRGENSIGRAGQVRTAAFTVRVPEQSAAGSEGGLPRVSPVSRPAVSQHLRVLKDVGLVRDTRQGTRRVYAVAPEGVEALRAYAEQLWQSALQGFAIVAEQAAHQREEEHP